MEKHGYLIHFWGVVNKESLEITYTVPLSRAQVELE